MKFRSLLWVLVSMILMGSNSNPKKPKLNVLFIVADDLKKEIDKTDKEIDQMVYELYGLTEEEIKIVEEATA